MSYHNTVNEKGDTLRQYEKQTMTQDNRIACFFESNPGEIFCPWEIKTLLFDAPDQPPTPITSIRRSMSDLTKAGILEKTEHKKDAGAYGRRSYAWTLNESYRESQQLLLQSDQPGTQQVLEDLDKDLARRDAPDAVAYAISSLKDGEDQKPIESRNGPKTSPQRKLFDVPPLEPVNCRICGKLLTAPYSIKMGVGPVCQGKCLTDVLKKEKYGLG